jgi:hypothetical protein
MLFFAGLLGLVWCLQGCEDNILAREAYNTSPMTPTHSLTSAPTAAPTRSYQYVQQVGLQLDTSPEYVGGKSSYVGVTKIDSRGRNVVDNVVDAEKRVEVMKDMMNIAYESAHWERSPQVLKIFMAPEFFFRGANGAYDIEKLADCADPSRACGAPVIRILELLREEVKKVKWNDWMFVFGTIVAHSIKEEEFFNFAPVMRGGPSGTTKHHIIAKTYISGIDFVKRSDLLFRTGGQVALPPDRFYDVFSELEKQTLANEGFTLDDVDDVFVMDGIRFGVEVCLDHFQGVLKDQTSRPVQVHLVTSAGMKIYTDNGVTYDTSTASFCGPLFLQDSGKHGGTQYFCPGCSYAIGGSASDSVNTVKYNVFSFDTGYKQEKTTAANTYNLYNVFDDGILSSNPPVINFAPSVEVNKACF